MSVAAVLRGPAALAALIAFADTVRSVALDTYAGNERTCIETTRIAVTAGRALGYPVTPVAVACGSASADFWNWKGPAADRPGWAVGVAATGAQDAVGNRWDGHLVGFCDTGTAGFLLDFTAPQRHRPNRGVHVPAPIVLPIDASALADGIVVRSRDGVVHWYRRSADVGWRRAGGWTAHRHVVVRAAGQVIRAHTALLAEVGADTVQR